MSNPIRTKLRLLFTAAGQDVSQSVLPDLLSFTFSDKETGEADELRLTLKDETGKWAATWKPDGGEVVDAYLATGSGADELHCGRFYVDSMSVSGAPRTFEMQAVSTPLNQPIRRKAITKAWESRTLRGIAEEIAAENGLQLFFDVEEDPQYDRRDQKEESNLAFLQRLCEDEGFSIKVTDQKIVIFDQRSYETKEPIKTITLGVSDVLSWSFSSQQSETYRTCVVAWRDMKKKSKDSAGGYDFSKTPEKPGTVDEELEKLRTPDYRAQKNPAVNYFSYTDPTVDASGQEYRVRKRVTSKAEAERLAKATLRKVNLRRVTGSLTVIGDPSLLAGCVIACEGFGSFDGNFIIESSSHDVGGGGYTTSLQLRRVNREY